jgi:hypothetical protein
MSIKFFSENTNFSLICPGQIEFSTTAAVGLPPKTFSDLVNKLGCQVIIDTLHFVIDSNIKLPVFGMGRL